VLVNLQDLRLLKNSERSVLSLARIASLRRAATAVFILGRVSPAAFGSRREHTDGDDACCCFACRNIILL